MPQQKLKIFLWLLVHRRLPTATILNQRNIITSNHCPHYGIEEDMHHIFFSCPKNLSIWGVLNINTPISNPLDWIKNICAPKSNTSQPNNTQIHLSILTPILLCHIWLNRNHNIFNNSFIIINNDKAIAYALEYLYLTNHKNPKAQVTKIPSGGHHHHPTFIN